jgi:uncharacterized protein DUF3310
LSGYELIKGCKCGTAEAHLSSCAYRHAERMEMAWDALIKETVEHPAHYNMGKYEVLDVILDWRLDYLLGNVIKYVARSRHKGSELTDLCKAREYLNRKIKELTQA